MKKIVSFILIISMLFLVGCSYGKYEVQPGEMKDVYDNYGLTQIKGIDEDVYDVVGMDLRKNTATMLITNIPNDNDSFYFYVIDAESGKVAKKKKVTADFKMESINGIFSDNEGNIYIYDDYNKQSAKFNKNLKFIETEEYEPKSTIEKYKANKYYDDSFSIYDSCARYYSSENNAEYFDIILFPGENDAFYLSDEKANDYLATNKKLALACDYESSRATYKIFDFEKKTLVNSSRLPYYETKDGSTSPLISAINDTYVFSVCGTYYTDETSKNIAYIWNYKIDSKNKKIQFDRYDDTTLDKQINQLKTDLKSKYNVNVILNKNPGVVPNNADVELKTSKIKTYIILKQFNKFCSTLPNGLINEIINEYPNGNFLDLYIIKDIKDDSSSAFANIYEDSPLICLSTDDFTYSNIPHEFMHILDIKLINTYEKQGKYFFEEWDKLNYDGFEYGLDSNEYDEKNESYFVSSYAMTSQQEDRAEIFMQLYMNQFTPKDNTKKKADYLCNNLKKAYKSISNSNNLIWE